MFPAMFVINTMKLNGNITWASVSAISILPNRNDAPRPATKKGATRAPF